MPIHKKLQELGEALKGRKVISPKERHSPSNWLWKGPYEDGITFSMLNRFLTCRERFYVQTVLGIRPNNQFNHRIEYGQMWHVCEENQQDDWQEALFQYSRNLQLQYPLSRDEIDRWGKICESQFEVYLEFWKGYTAETCVESFESEIVFDVLYILQGGEYIRLRGKRDADIIMKHNGVRGKVLQENKTKGDVDILALQKQLTGDLQTMMYLTVMSRTSEDLPVIGTLYNVVKRPLSGGKGSIRQHQPSKSKPSGETENEFLDRLEGIITEDPHAFFTRFFTTVSREQIEEFNHQTLSPILLSVCQWWKWITSPEGIADRFASPLHYRHPYGATNSIDEYGASEVDNYLNTGSMVGLHRAEKLFTELT